ncbi:D-alanyl-D-alanine carboxypeptidase family protein [Blastococcus sp. PRF04-17]|uniref:D-alanyl-D-alanine carboxypeptidase family protein n=1 Tax=Blastococcus sp. PRF04-17 TaxID=2933797 RepID=UPI001FF43196|nr:serine hydrolase [Blastococcus sp. PRF04-17]UOY01142.1 serine hydrolase [Blastococcus sp. PRF04-17]
MELRRRCARVAAALLVTAALLLPGGLAAAEDDPRPTVDPSVPTPSTPYAGRPPQGSAPDGSMVGGEDLGTRDVVVPDDAPDLPPGIAASGWLVADAGTGDVLAARDPHGRFYPASTLKTLTLLALMPLLDPDQVVEGTAEDENVEGSRVGLVRGGRYPVSVLFLGLILQSGNDAANALARAAGGVDVALEAMNEKAEQLGAFDTVAGTPSGLDVTGQSSSPYDLALIFRALLEDPRAAAILATPTAQMPAVEGRTPGYQIQNQNPLLGAYEGNLGGKTGFTDAARHTFVTAAERNGRRLVVSVMDTESRPLRAADQAALLLDWGFALPADVESVGTLVEPGEVDPSPASSASSAASSAGRAQRTSTAGAAPPVQDAESSPFVPVALAVGAVVIVTATLIGRRRAVRLVPATDRAPTDPVRRPPGRSVRSSGPPPAPPPRAGSPSTPP